MFAPIPQIRGGAYEEADHAVFGSTCDTDYHDCFAQSSLFPMYTPA